MAHSQECIEKHRSRQEPGCSCDPAERMRGWDGLEWLRSLWARGENEIAPIRIRRTKTSSEKISDAVDAVHKSWDELKQTETLESGLSKEKIMPAEIQLRVRSVVVSQFGFEHESVLPEKNLRDDFGADDLDLVELTMALEDEFDREVPDEQAEKWKTVSDIIAYFEPAPVQEKK